MLTLTLILTAALSLASYLAADRTGNPGAVMFLTLFGLPAMPVVEGWRAFRAWRVRRYQQRYNPYA
jgi:hypothetical protein